MHLRNAVMEIWLVVMGKCRNEWQTSVETLHSTVALCFIAHFFLFLVAVYCVSPVSSYRASHRAISEQKVRMKRLGTDLTSAQKEMRAKHKAYENAVGILSRRLQEALTDKEAAEAELVKLKAQVSEGGNSHALQVQATLSIQRSIEC